MGDLVRIDPVTGVESLNGVQAMDISNPSSPVRGPRMETSGSAIAKRVDIYGSYAYVATDAGVWIVGLGNFQ